MPTVTLFIISVVLSASKFANSAIEHERHCLTTPELLVKLGYHGVKHTIQTKDGYLLDLFELPVPRLGHNGRPFLFLHGMFSNSEVFAFSKLAPFMADRGYDVWLGNVRGTKYSSHVNLTKQDHQFWDYSMDEIATIDLPTMIDYILKLTRQPKLYFCGTSLANNEFFMMMSELPKYNDKVIAMVSYGATVHGNHNKDNNHMRLLVPWIKDIEALPGGRGEFPFLSLESFRTVFKRYCLLKKDLCNSLYTVFNGYNFFNKDPEIAKLTLTMHDPMSIKTIVHVHQTILLADNVQKYDYGEEGNMAKYGTPQPPSYNISLTTCPVLLYSAGNDQMTSNADTQQLIRELPNVVKHTVLPTFMHQDFISSPDRFKVYQQIYEDLNKLETKGE